MNTVIRGVSYLTKITADLGPKIETFFSKFLFRLGFLVSFKIYRVFIQNFEIQISLITVLHAIEGENS